MFDRLLYRLSKRKSRRHFNAWLSGVVRTYDIAAQSAVINIGAGGEIAGLLADLGVKSTSLDIDPLREPDVVASVESMDSIGTDTIDAVFCLEVLEHVREPHMAAAEIARILRPGGLLIGSTPFLLGIHDAPADYFRFTRHGLSTLFSGLAELDLRDRNGYFEAVAVLIYRRFAVDVPRGMRMLLLAPLLLLIAMTLEILDRFLPSVTGTTGYFFIYRKPQPVEAGPK